MTGDIAWGGNWFFLVNGNTNGNGNGHELTLDNLESLTDFTWRIRQALNEQGITGANGQEIDHIELFAPSQLDGVNSKNFVLCPGKAYDRSPCGTGTSAKLACLYADGKLREGQIWRQESIVGSVLACPCLVPASLPAFLNRLSGVAESTARLSGPGQWSRPCN